jgi:coenzyme F420 hydrogenase subunit beta
MVENPEGGYVPRTLGPCKSGCTECLHVCPFQNHDVNEDSLGKAIHGFLPEIMHTGETGYFLGAYVGHVSDPQHRWQGASGGMATWFLKQLLLDDVVDHVICVTPNANPNQLFQFEVISDPEAITRSAKSAYYPLELSKVLKAVCERPGRYALIGLPCFVKAVRLAAIRNAKVRGRIKVYAGLICGQLKTKAFAESLARRMEIPPEKITKFCFRDKAPDRPATNFSITAQGEHFKGSIAWNDFYVLAWMAGMFKIRACDYCDDIFSELADISFMDAWLPEYTSENRGTSLVLTRSARAEQIIQEKAIATGACSLIPIPIERVIESQLGIIEQKRKLLARRLWMAKTKAQSVPEKRVPPVRPNLLEYLMILNAEAVRKRSFTALARQRQNRTAGLSLFMQEMKPVLYVRKWLYRFKKENIRSGLKRRFDWVKEHVHLKKKTASQ